MNRRAFTLVEMLAAAALSAVLLLTVLVVIGSIGRERRAALDRSKAEVPPELAELIRWDLVNAREIRSTGGRVTLAGFGAIEPRTFAPASHRPVEVVYEVRRAAGRLWLVRRQHEQGAAGRSATELLCADVARFVLTPLEDERPLRPTTRAATRPSTGPASRPSMLPALAPCVRMQIAWDDPRRAPIDRILVLR